MYELAKVSLNNKGNEIRSAERRSLEGKTNVDHDVEENGGRCETEERQDES